MVEAWERRAGCHSLDSAFRLFCAAAGRMPHRQTLYLVCQPACSSGARICFAEGSPWSPWPLGPMTIWRGDSFLLLLYFLLGVYGVVHVGVNWGTMVNGRRNLVFRARQSSWDRHVGGGHRAQGWLRPIRFECVRGKKSCFSPLPSKALSLFRPQGLRGFCFCPL